jgi:hypothetical protein
MMPTGQVSFEAKTPTKRLSMRRNGTGVGIMLKKRTHKEIRMPQIDLHVKFIYQDNLPEPQRDRKREAAKAQLFQVLGEMVQPGQMALIRLKPWIATPIPLGESLSMIEETLEIELLIQ